MLFEFYYDDYWKRSQFDKEETRLSQNENVQMCSSEKSEGQRFSS